MYNGNLAVPLSAGQCESTQKRVRVPPRRPGINPQKLVRMPNPWRTGMPTQNRVRRRNGYAEVKRRRFFFAAQNWVRFRAICRRIGYAVGVERMKAARVRTCFCVDNLRGRPPGDAIRRQTWRKRRIPAGLPQKRVRFTRLPLWKSLWKHGVIPAETSTLGPQIQVRGVADSGSALRRIEYVCPQIRVRRGDFFSYRSRS